MKPIGLYIHIPFCVKKCAYCDFNSLVPEGKKQIKAYLKALLEDIRISALNCSRHIVKSIYLGGGTPSLIEAEDIGHILAEVRSNFDLSGLREVTIEANPESISWEKLSLYKKNGINRISMGVQSFDDKSLMFLGRAHTADDALNAIKLVKKVGIEKVSIDLIYGLSGQTLNDWENDLDRFLNTGIAHVSFYDLKIEKGTPLYRIRNNLEVAGNDLQARMYRLGCEKLTKAGFFHYEISSFALRDQESIHNSIYWRNKEYIGLGAGAYSYLNGLRFAKVKSIYKYIQQAKAGKFRRYNQERLGHRERLIETIILNLRLLRGFSLETVEKNIGIRADSDLLGQLKELEQEKLIVSSSKKCRLSKKGILYYDIIASKLL